MWTGFLSALLSGTVNYLVGGGLVASTVLGALGAVGLIAALIDWSLAEMHRAIMRGEVE